jgi:hypothetical protein
MLLRVSYCCCQVSRHAIFPSLATCGGCSLGWDTVSHVSSLVTSTYTSAVTIAWVLADLLCHSVRDIDRLLPGRCYILVGGGVDGIDAVGSGMGRPCRGCCGVSIDLNSAAFMFHVCRADSVSRKGPTGVACVEGAHGVCVCWVCLNTRQPGYHASHHATWEM